MENAIRSSLNNFVSNNLELPSPLQKINWPTPGISLFIKRDDLIHPMISGNKWRKLYGHLEMYGLGKFEGIISMGSAYSNHLHALSYVCFQLKIPCICLVYNHGPLEQSPTMRDCLNWQAKCTSITKATASQWRQYSAHSIEIEGKSYMWIPEGGGGIEGESGIRQLVAELPIDFDQSDHLILCGCGTGTTIKGILQATKNVLIASKRVVRSGVYDFEDHSRLIWMGKNDIVKFAKMDLELKLFIQDFQEQHGILLDRVYTGPLLLSYSKAQNLPSFQRIYFIHTGGLQGNRLE